MCVLVGGRGNECRKVSDKNKTSINKKMFSKLTPSIHIVRNSPPTLCLWWKTSFSPLKLRIKSMTMHRVCTSSWKQREKDLVTKLENEQGHSQAPILLSTLLRILVGVMRRESQNLKAYRQERERNYNYLPLFTSAWSCLQKIRKNTHACPRTNDELSKLTKYSHSIKPYAWD